MAHENDGLVKRARFFRHSQMQEVVISARILETCKQEPGEDWHAYRRRQQQESNASWG